MRALHLFVWFVVFANVLAVPATLAQGHAAARPISATTTSDWSMQVVTDDLSYPWHLNHVGDLIVISEAAGNIVMIDDGGMRRYAVRTSDPIVHDGGSGLLGMALSEDFPTSGLAYLYHSYRSGSGLTNKVIEARFDGESWRETRVLLSGIPGHRLYNGGRIAIGPEGLVVCHDGLDGERYAAAGPRQSGRQDPPHDTRRTGAGEQSLRAILRSTSYGHRNPQGLCVERRRRSLRCRTRTIGP